MIRRLAGGDAAHGAEIARLLGESFSSPDQRWSAASVSATLSMPGTVALVAEDGCAILRLAAEEAEILTIAVLPAARRQGRARVLVDACLREAAAAGAARMHLEVACSNGAARALYRSAGFAETGRRRGYYRGPNGCEDAVLMGREIGSAVPAGG